jgi:hypothetical protein
MRSRTTKCFGGWTLTVNEHISGEYHLILVAADGSGAAFIADKGSVRAEVLDMWIKTGEEMQETLRLIGHADMTGDAP